LLSVVIPVHNEELILRHLVEGIISGLADFTHGFELILSENGSADQTLTLARELAQHYPQVVVLTNPEAGYGKAIKAGILQSRGDYVVIFNADLWDLDFLRTAVKLLGQYDIVIASKRHHDSHDQRPLNRRLITLSFNLLLHVMFGFKGSDTHGMKAFRRVPLVPVVRACITNREIFDTEVILRAQRAGLTTVEVPTVVEETRPSRYSPFVRIPRTLKDLGRLYRDLNWSSRTTSSALDTTPDQIQP
jgi:glycosyltransferase involved in cell wall biosynthesis